MKNTPATTIAETNDSFIVSSFEKDLNSLQNKYYESESQMEASLIAGLEAQGYTYRPDIRDQEAMLRNVKSKIEKLNKIVFEEDDWLRFVQKYLDPSTDTFADKAKRVHEDFISDFIFKNGIIKNIYLFKKDSLAENSLEVINQFEKTGLHKNIYDVTLLVNGIPLVQIELKRRGVDIREAFNQIHRYSKESFNSDNSLYKYLQLFIISNGTYTLYFSNTIKREKTSYDFTMNWADFKNKPISDLTDFIPTFLQKKSLLEIIFKYSVLTVDNDLMIMRPYQIAAAERILNRIFVQEQSGLWGKEYKGGYVWHSTGSGKTLTSFKAAQLATTMGFVDKVLFVVDRKDLDYQTMKEYSKFNKDSVSGSNNTEGLRKNLENSDSKIVVTTIQKLSKLISPVNASLSVFDKKVVFIFDECHRSQFGEAQNAISKKFKKYIQFGFTGTPIFPENAANSTDPSMTTEGVFGRSLHTYSIIDAMRDRKVLKFKVDFNTVGAVSKESQLEKTNLPEEVYLHPDRISKIAKYILNTFKEKTHAKNNKGVRFNAMFAVRSVDAAKAYYKEFKKIQELSPREKRIKIAVIYSYAANEEQSCVGSIEDETLSADKLELTAKEALKEAIADYNELFSTSFTIDGDGFQQYQKDVAMRAGKNVEIDLLIVVGMFLTGFDAPRLNTLYVDKHLKYHGLIQAYSRTNRIFGESKQVGNIVTFVDLQQPTLDALRLFGDGRDNEFIALDKRPFDEEIKELSNLAAALLDRFQDHTEIAFDTDKKEFCTLFGKYLKKEKYLLNYDEFHAFKKYKEASLNTSQDHENFKKEHGLTDARLDLFKVLKILSDRDLQDFKSTYHKLYEEVRQKQKEDEAYTDFDDIVFEVELLKSLELNFEYLTKYLFQNRFHTDLEKELASMLKDKDLKAKKDIITSFLKEHSVKDFPVEEELENALIEHARKMKEEKIKKLIEEEGLKEEETRIQVDKFLRDKKIKEEGPELGSLFINKLSPLSAMYGEKKKALVAKLKAFLEEFKELG